MNMATYQIRILYREDGELQTAIIRPQLASFSAARRYAKEAAERLGGRVWDVFKLNDKTQEVV